MKIYEYTDHRIFIRESIQARKKTDGKFTAGILADAAGMKPSFFSQALGGSQEFSHDQLFAIGQFMDLDEEELDFLILLNEYHRCSLNKRQEELLGEIEAVQHRHLRVIEYIAFDRVDFESSPVDEYLCEPLAPIVEPYFASERYLKDPEELRQRLGIAPERFERIMGIMVRAKIIEPTDVTGPGGPEYRPCTDGDLMVYKINAAAKFNAVYSRLKAAEKTFAGDETDLVSTILFCANDDFIRQVKSEILDFQNYAIDEFRKYPAEEVYFVNTDLFPVG